MCFRPKVNEGMIKNGLLTHYRPVIWKSADSGKITLNAYKTDTAANDAMAKLDGAKFKESSD